MKKPYVAYYTVIYRSNCIVYADDEKSASELAQAIWADGAFDPEDYGIDESGVDVAPATERECLDYQYRTFLDDENLTDAEVEELWNALEDVPMNPETERMEKPFLIFPANTPREEIWNWFDRHHSKGVAYLLYGEEPQATPPAAPVKFTIERTINGKRVTIELTPEELTRAYFDQKDMFDRLDVSDYFNELSDRECLSAFGAERKEIIPLIPEIAQIVRKQMDNWGAEFCAAVEYAIPEVLKNHRK